jgi:hypothetical protein
VWTKLVRHIGNIDEQMTTEWGIRANGDEKVHLVRALNAAGPRMQRFLRSTRRCEDPIRIVQGDVVMILP